MKNTEYKDVFDFGEEALSMEDKFSAPSFPSFKNAFTLGENIRGMTNVSPLATVKFFNQTSDDLLTKYYPDSENVQKGNTNVITDADISNSELNRFEEDYYFDNNHNGKFGDSGDILAFKLVLFISTDGLKIRESYEVTEPKNDEIILFLETDGGLSKQVLFGKMSEKVRKQFTDKNGNLKSNLYDSEILKGVRKYYKDANQEVIEKLIKNGYIEESIIKEGFFKVLKYLGIATNALPKITGWILGKLGSWIDYLKIDEQFWNTENENYFLKKENIIENFTISTETIKKIEELLNNQDDLSVADLMPEAIEEGIQYIVSKTKTTIEQYNEFVKEKIEELYSAFDNPTADFIFKDLAEGFAFLCGIWNGAVDFISGTFKFAALLLQAPFNIVSEFQTTLELVDNFWDTITTKIFWVNLWESTKETYTKIKNELTNLDSANFNWVKIAYFTGFGLATIVSFFIPVAQIANVAKAGKIGEIIAKFTSEISNGFVKGANIIGQKSVQAFENSIKIFREMLALFSQGKKKLTAFFENVWKKIVEWFKKNKKFLSPRYEEVADLTVKELDWMASRNIGNLGGLILKESQIRKLRGILKNKGITLIVDGDINSVTKLFQPIDQFKSFEDLIFFMKTSKTPKVGMFHAGTQQMILTKNCTEIVAFHEMCHLKHFKEIGEIAYKGLSRLDKEMYVWKQILANRGKWTEAELKDSLDYINRIRTEQYGLK
ncbi:zincin-like metallopeptidase toxin domain-containing protein, partial [uncultured Chryseobacterium sp.]|uniref:zincin-like metallopeptidase toxin domain-containing protein n=1 Tax=uncultured Chryseobacterium sp. TaxID=259322 RepID=UPI0025F66B6C